MSILDEMEESSKSTAPVFMEFLYRYDPKKKQIFAFYEGDEDSSYYSNIIKRVIDPDYKLEEIVAGCKNNVLKVQKEFNWNEYNNKQIAFFVDRDLSFWLDDTENLAPNVFVTDFYSVENYAVKVDVLEAWLKNFEGFARAKKQEIDYMLYEYESNITMFNKEMMFIMAQAVVAKRHDKSVRLSDLNLVNNKNIAFKMEDNHLKFDFFIDEEKISKVWKLENVENQEIQAQIKEFKTKIEHYSVRGKWLLHFVAEIGEYMRLHPNLFAPSLGKKEKLSPTCAVPTAHCFVALAPYCTEYIPKRLEQFLKSTYLQYYNNDY